MSGNPTTIVFLCCMAAVDRMQVWFGLPFWAAVFLAVLFAVLAGRSLTSAMRRGGKNENP